LYVASITEHHASIQKQSFDGQLYQEYSYQNLLKLDHYSSSYDEKKFWCIFYAPQCTTANKNSEF